MASLPPWLVEFARSVLSGILRSRQQQGSGPAAPRKKKTSSSGSTGGSKPRFNPPKPTAPKSHGPAPKAPRPAPKSPAPRSADDDLVSPGQHGPEATVEVHPGDVGAVRMTYHPAFDGDPDPGEIVWTWVPFEENDGRGKDRPVLVVAAEGSHGGSVLAVQLTSKNHSGDRDFVAIGSGSWDGEHRPSWVNIDRVMRVFPSGMRREAAALDETNYARVEAALRQRYGWS